MQLSLRSLAVGLLAIAAIVVTGAFAAYTQRASAASTVSSGDLIRGESFSAVYFMGADGFRYVFPNEKTYFTWYADFSTVKFISDEELGTIQIGGNATYKPGVKMVKINTDPKVYVVDNSGVLRSVASESDASTLYGSDWNTKIDDLPDAFFSNYTLSGEQVNTGSYVPATVTAGVANINIDKNLSAPSDFSITATGFNPTSRTISVDQTVRFTNNDTAKHSATGSDGSWGTGTISAGGNFVQRFTTAGTYSFYDGYNGSWTGTIIVE